MIGVLNKTFFMPEKQKLTFSLASKELEQIVQQMESGKLDIDEALAKFERGLELTKFLKKRLNEVENRVKELKGGQKD